MTIVANRTKPVFKRLAMPHTLVVVMALVVVVLAISWVIPSGEYQRTKVATSDGVREVTVAGTYHQVPKVYLGPQMLLESPIKGFLDASLLICFLLMIGGSFAIFQETGAVEFAISRLTGAITRRPHLEGLLIPSLMVVFSLGGSIFGMAEASSMGRGCSRSTWKRRKSNFVKKVSTKCTCWSSADCRNALMVGFSHFNAL